MKLNERTVNETKQHIGDRNYSEQHYHIKGQELNVVFNKCCKPTMSKI